MWEAYVKLTNLVAFSMYQKRLHHHPVVGHIKLGAVLYDSVCFSAKHKTLTK